MSSKSGFSGGVSAGWGCVMKTVGIVFGVLAALFVLALLLKMCGAALGA